MIQRYRHDNGQSSFLLKLVASFIDCAWSAGGNVAGVLVQSKGERPRMQLVGRQEIFAD